MASFLSKLFGGSSGKGTSGPKRSDPVSYNDLVIQAAPEEAGDQWRLAGFIIKQSDDGPLERKFLRADTFPSHDEAIEYSVRKAKQIIDEQGARLFADGEPTGRA
ncbi:MAG: transcriptional activator HlyU [Alphaproteobacteria bacterium]|nr:transcriptional activator HlyU [Alphaproteobacteria bacterium]